MWPIQSELRFRIVHFIILVDLVEAAAVHIAKLFMPDSLNSYD